MKIKVLAIVCLTSLFSCVQSSKAVIKEEVELSNQNKAVIKSESHNYGGWYCPDNLNGFPAVDIANWEQVPVINGRMPTKEETQNGTSLIFVDTEKHPNAKILNMEMPKLAKFYNENSEREDLIIVIQAFSLGSDSIVGFRYLNGGNGSARLSDVKFLFDLEIKMMPPSKYVTHNIKINATQGEVWDVLTNPNSVKSLQQIFDQDNKLKSDWNLTSNVNFHYENSGNLTSSYANKLFGNFYIHNNYNRLQYIQKFLLQENKKTKFTELKIVCGPYGDDFDIQNIILKNWAQKIKELSEKE